MPVRPRPTPPWQPTPSPLLSPCRIELLKASTHFYVCSPGWRSLFFIALRSTAKPFFYSHPPSPLLPDRDNCRLVSAGRYGGLGGKIAIFAKKKPRKRLGKLFDMLGSASPWLLNALMNFRPGNWATSLKRDESKNREWTDQKKKKKKNN